MWLNVYKAPLHTELRVRDSLRKAESRELLREFGTERQGWFDRLRCSLLCQLDHSLVVLGEGLEGYRLLHSLGVELQGARFSVGCRR